MCDLTCYSSSDVAGYPKKYPPMLLYSAVSRGFNWSLITLWERGETRVKWIRAEGCVLCGHGDDEENPPRAYDPFEKLPRFVTCNWNNWSRYFDYKGPAMGCLRFIIIIGTTSRSQQRYHWRCVTRGFTVSWSCT